MSNLNQIIPKEKKEFIHIYPTINPNSSVVWIKVGPPAPGKVKQEYYESHELLNKNINKTDPIVVFDPGFDTKNLYKIYDSVEPKNSTDGPSQIDTLKDDGINMPIIRLNNFSLKGENIDYMKIFFNDFLPKIHLVVKDKDNVIKLCDAPGWDNEIHVIITTELNGYYKKISLLFYIINIELFDDYISYDGEWKFQPFNKSLVSQFPPGEDKKITTFELLKGLANINKVGFASTNNIPQVEDGRYRIIKGEPLRKWIPEQVKFGGIGTENIYDCWIDLNGYLVLVDVAWVLNQGVTEKDLGIINMVGMHNETNSFGDGILKPLLMPRVLTNNQTNVNNYNLLIDTYENIMDNEYIHEEGSLHKNYFLKSYSETNQLDELDTQIIENSVEGAAYSQEYENDRFKLIGIEYKYEGDDSEIIEPMMNKVQIHDHFFTKMRSRIIKVLLKRYNLGLQRGTLIYVLIKEYNLGVAKAIDKDQSNIDEKAGGTPNPFASGMYYIDGMEFEYKQEENKINQYLFLIKKDPIDDIVSKVNKPA